MDFDKILHMVDNFYQELLSSSGSTKEIIWGLISRCIQAMFEDLCKVHTGAQNVTSDPDPMLHCTKCLCSVIQTHDIIQTFEDLCFSHCPVITPVFNCHVHKMMVMMASIQQMNDQIISLTEQLSHFDSL